MPGRYGCPTDAASSTIARRACRRTPASTSARSTATPESQSTTRLLATDSDPVYVPASDGSGDGFILFLRQGSLLAQAFDGAQLLGRRRFPYPRTSALSAAMAGFPPRPRGRWRFGPAPLAVPRSIWSGSTGKGSVWDSSGPSLDLGTSVQLSPDGKRVVITRGALTELSGALGNIQGARIWTAELSRAIFSRLTPGGGNRERSRHLAGRSRGVHLGAERRRRPVLDQGRRHRDAGTAAGEVSHGQASERVLPGWAIPDLRRSHDAAAGPVDPSHHGAAERRAQADSVSRHAGRRDLRSVLA